MKVRQFLSVVLICATLHGCTITQQYSISGPIQVTWGAVSTQADHYKKLLDSTVLLTVSLKEGIPFVGSGTVIDAAKGIILTNDHMVPDNATGVIVQVDRGVTYKVRTWDKFPDCDLAILYCEKAIEATNATLAKNEPDIGDEIVLVGSPYGREQFNTLSFGYITAKGRFDWKVPDVKLYQTDALIVGGSSGGPWFDKTGCVIGITSMTKGSSGNIGLGIPLSDILKVLQEKIDAK